MFTANKSLEGSSNIFVVAHVVEFLKIHKSGSKEGTKVSGVGTPNDGFLLNTVKTLFRLSKVLFDL